MSTEKKGRMVDVRRLRIACVGCGEMIREDVRISPEGSMDVIYVPPCPHCFPNAPREEEEVRAN